MTFTEKFFSERELTFPEQPEDSEISKKEEAIQWFNTLKSQLENLHIYEHDSFGQSLSEQNKTITPRRKLVRKIATNGQNHSRVILSSLSLNTPTHRKNPSREPTFFFRGQSRSDYAFHSTLYRELLKVTKDVSHDFKPKDVESYLQRAEKKTLQAAWTNGIGHGLTPLERLTLLQHHGTPTRLIDVSSDWKVALYFACSGNACHDGRLFLIVTDSNRWQQFPNAAKRSTNSNSIDGTDLVWSAYQENFNQRGIGHWLKTTWPILLPFSDPRMIAQKGFFLVGGLPSMQGEHQLYTSQCSGCNQKLCIGSQEGCSAPNTYGRKRKTLTINETRQITSFLMRFPGTQRSIESLSQDLAKKDLSNTWSTVCYSVKVPARFKPYILQELSDNEHLYYDSIFPPFLETNRLLKSVVEQDFRRIRKESDQHTADST